MPRTTRRTSLIVGLLLTVGLGASSVGVLAPAGASGPAASAPRVKRHRAKTIAAVGAENQYANVISQIGGRYVKVASVMSNPNIDPHSFEASPSVARLVGSAQLVIQNGLGYDTFMNRIEAAAPSATRKVIDVQTLLRLPSSTKNPHLWYSPRTMPAVAKAVAADLAALEPGKAAYFTARAKAFDRSLKPWLAAIAKLRSRFAHVGVATTEPVGDDLLLAVGADIKTPWTLQADIMNGVDPAPESVSLQESLFSRHKVKVFLYNEQVTDSLTETFLADARRAHIPVVGVYETMPTPGYDYQSWMLAEVHALSEALSAKRSTERL